MSSDSLGVISESAKKSFALATALFPGEQWVLREPGIWVAKSRLRDSARERAKLAWEIEQIRALSGGNNAVYFLPEVGNDDNPGKLSADAVINGEIVEIKTVRGTRATLGTEFRKGYKQGAYLCRKSPAVKAHSVFVRLFSSLSPGSVRAKIAGELKERHDEGRFICYFEATGTLQSWTYEELRKTIGKKSPGPIFHEAGIGGGGYSGPSPTAASSGGILDTTTNPGPRQDL